MAVYEYEAIARSGKRVKGVIDADSPAAARRKLRDQNMFPTEIAESFTKSKGGATSKKHGFGWVSQRDISVMTRQLAVLLAAGMPLVEALSALIEQTTNPRLQKIIYDVRDRVNEGVRLADAMGAHGRVFPDLYVNMVGAGETSGALEQVLFRLADIMERQVKLTRKIRGTLAYPAFMVVVGISVISFLMIVIVPKITAMFEKQERSLPLITQILIQVCHFAGRYWPAMVLLVLGAFFFWRFWVSRPQGRKSWDRFKLWLPLYRDLYIRVIAGRFARTLGTMLNSGLTMMTSLDVVKTVLQNRVLEEAMDEVKSDVRRGKDLSAPLREVGYFPPLLISMVELGQRSGELDAMLLRVADTYDDEVETNIDALVSLLEPAMILIMAFFVGFLVISILLPIFDLSSGF